MSRTSGSVCARFIHKSHNRSCTVGIQRHIVKRGKMSVFSRPFSAKDDSEAIAAWRLDLDRIRRVVEVRPLASAFYLTTIDCNFPPPD